jgi:hypothetical protein
MAAVKTTPVNYWMWISAFLLVVIVAMTIVYYWPATQKNSEEKYVELPAHVLSGPSATAPGVMYNRGKGKPTAPIQTM